MQQQSIAVDSSGPEVGIVVCTLVQIEISDGPCDLRLAGVLSTLAAVPKSDLYLLPEIWQAGYFSFDAYESAAEPMDGPTVSRLREFARDRGAWVHGGSFVERSANGDLFNTSVLIDDSGDLAAIYRKIHLFGFESKETQILTPGSEPAVVRTPFGIIGLATCYDLRFPELFREMAWQGAGIFLVASAWPEARAEHWEILTSARAIENQAYLLACNGAGENRGVRLGGRSRVIDPWGNIVGQLGTDASTATLQIAPDVVAQCRQQFPAFQDSTTRRFST